MYYFSKCIPKMVIVWGIPICMYFLYFHIDDVGRQGR